MDAVTLARRHPERQVVFFAVGFETTAPANAMAAYQAKREELRNFSLLVSHVLVPPAIEAILSSPANQVQGFLAAGHVCTVMGYTEYEPIAQSYGVPIVVTGFEPVDILQGLYMCVRQLETGRAEVENQYSRVVSREGNLPAQRIMREVFEIVDRNWRGIGVIPRSGFALRAEYRDFDAERRFALSPAPALTASPCIAGQVLQGVKRPHDCPAFGTACTPERPLGAPMVSSEGACAAYYRHRRSRPRA
jgi:hydrogenase expression/formation protein HypD